MHRYLESRRGRPGDTKILLLDPLRLRGQQVTGLTSGESITVSVSGPDGTIFLPETAAEWRVVHTTDRGVSIWAWAVPFTLPEVTEPTLLTVTWRVRLLEAQRTVVDQIEVDPDA